MGTNANLISKRFNAFRITVNPPASQDQSGSRGFSGIRSSGLHPAVAADEGVGAAVVLEFGFSGGLEFGDDFLGEDFSEFDTPLVEGVDVPDHALGEDAHLVERDEAAEGGGGEFFGEEDIRGAVAFEDAVWCERGGGAFGLDLG